MKANAPERLYLIQHNGLISYCRNNDEDIEYTRTDSFIEKACEFLKDRIEHDSIDYPMATKHLVEDFKKYMEE